MKNKFLLAIMAAGLITIYSCQKSEDPGGTATQEIAGEWFVQVKVNNAVISDYIKISTYNTSENVAQKMWIDDLKHFWEFKAKVNVDPSAKTFSATDADDEYHGIKVDFTGGKILKGVSKGPVSKAVTDSIYFEAEFSDDPGTKYQFTGYRRTRWPEDDH
jgi:Lipid-binding putative hydrolase